MKDRVCGMISKGKWEVYYFKVLEKVEKHYKCNYL